MDQGLIMLKSIIQDLTQRLERYIQKPDSKQSFIDNQNKLLSEIVAAYNQFERYKADPLAVVISQEIEKLDAKQIQIDGFHITVRRDTTGRNYSFIFVNDYN